MKLENKVAIVTGGANGIGRAIALLFAQEGANVVVSDIEIEPAKKVVQEIEALGRKAIATKTDVSKSAETNAMAKATIDKFGKIDILVNNAGGSARERRSLFKDSTEEVWDFVFGINLKGVRNCTRAVINHMVERKYGKVVNIASCAGIVGDPGAVDYSAAKAGTIGFTMALAKEVVRYGINVNCISPGPIATRFVVRQTSNEHFQKLLKLTGMLRSGEPEDIANMALFLVMDESNFITGQNYPVCGLRNLGGAQD